MSEPVIESLPGKTTATTTTPTPMPSPSPPPPSDAPAKLLYLVDSRRASFGELWRDQRRSAVLFAWLAKIGGVRLVGSVNDPNVETLAPFEIEISELASEDLAMIEPALREMYILGFDLIAVHGIVDEFNHSRTLVATMQRGDGSAVGRVWHRIEGAAKTHHYIDFLTPFPDGTYIWSTSAKSVLDAPVVMHVSRQTCATPKALWERHQAAVQRRAMRGGAQLVPATGREQVLALVERHHAIVRDFHLARKLFRAVRASDQQRVADWQARLAAAAESGTAYPPVWAELVRMQQRKTGFGSALVLLVVSLALFIGIGASQWEWDFLAIIVGILAFHELGHFLAMKVFGYRNVRMFFIPMLGAAVSGVNYSAPGWKKVIVALMGPLPGIAAGGVIGAIGLYRHDELLMTIAFLSLALNGLNLLPVLPLDGGRVMHTLFFARHWVLDLIFRVTAALVLIVASWVLGDWVLMLIGVVMVVGIPSAYRLARVASDLRRQGVRRATADEQMIPRDIADQVIAQVRQAFRKPISIAATARYTLNVYETINTRPPGWLVTTMFTLVHVSAMVFVVLAGVLLVLVKRGAIALPFERPAAEVIEQQRPPKYVVVAEQMRVMDVAAGGGQREARPPEFDQRGDKNSEGSRGQSGGARSFGMRGMKMANRQGMIISILKRMSPALICAESVPAPPSTLSLAVSRAKKVSLPMSPKS